MKPYWHGWMNIREEVVDHFVDLLLSDRNEYDERLDYYDDGLADNVRRRVREAVTLNPSVGNWNQDCRSHYVIERNRVIECGRWSDVRVEAERRRDRRAKAAYYGRTTASARLDAPPTAAAGDTEQSSGLWSRFWAWFSK